MENRNRVYDFVKKQLKEKKQAYVVAPLIEESDKIDAKSAEELHKELSQKFAGFQVALIHGAMKQEEKDFIMGEFSDGNIDVLVSTVVIEVGINVPNATVMVVENCERFGLAPSSATRPRRPRQRSVLLFLICHNETDVAKERNQIMCERKMTALKLQKLICDCADQVSFFGTRQHGLPEMHISDLVRHGDVLEKAKTQPKRL